jgi:hypothetical protein
MGAIMNLAWKHILPALQESSIEENSTAFQELEEKLSNIKLSTVKGENTSSLDITGKTFKIDKNPYGITSFSHNFDGDENSISLTIGEELYTIPIGYEELKKGECKIGRMGDQVLASSAAWIADTLRIKSYFYETPYNATINLVFSENKVEIISKPNVSFGRAGIIELVGYTE